MNLLQKVKEYIILSRVYFAGYIATIPILGALAISPSTGWRHLLILFIIGIFMHLYAYNLNEWFDYNIDKHSKYLQEKPLISGRIPRYHTLIIGFISVAISLIITSIYFNISSIIFLLITIAFITIYDLTTKRVIFNEFFQSLSALSFCLFGAISTGTYVNDINFFTWMIAFAYFLKFMSASISCGVGLKDIENDIENKTVTLPILLGVKVKNKKLHLTFRYKVISYFLEILFLSIFIINYFIALDYLKYWYIGVSLLIVSLISFYLFHFFYTKAYKTYSRRKLLKLGKIHEVTTYNLFPIILFPIIGFTLVAILLIIPLAWGIATRHLIYKTRIYH